MTMRKLTDYFRSRKSIFYAPLQFANSVRKNLRLDAKLLRPFRKTHSCSIEGNKAIRGLVSGILSVGCPPNIHRPSIVKALGAFAARIISIVVDAVNCEFLFGLPHITNKGRIVMPSATERYSPSAITIKMIVVWIVAAAFYIKPNIVNPRFGHSMLPVCFGCSFSFEASTGAGVSSDKGIGKNKRFTATFAFAEPRPPDSLAAIQANYSESSKGASGKVMKPWRHFDKLATREHHHFSIAHIQMG